MRAALEPGAPARGDASVRGVQSMSELEQHRQALTGHCYRMLGSAMDADDAVQETMLRAWRNLERLEAQASLRPWLYRIATNVCLDAIGQRSRRERPVEAGPRGTIDDELTIRDRSHWLEPIPDAIAIPSDADPAERAILRESIRLAFVAALQHLPAKQRASLILAEVLGWSADEIAGCLETSTAAVNSALQRARATLASRDVGALGAGSWHDDAGLAERYAAAFERYDVDALTALLRDDAVLSMPPYTLWLQGHDAIHAWLAGRGAGCRGSRLLPTAASGQPAWGQYRPSASGSGHDAWALLVIEPAGDRLAAMTSFLDTQQLFPRFGLPLQLPAGR